MSISSQRVKQWRSATKQKMVAAMGGKCQCCGYDTCDSALAFHHIDPSQKDLAFGSIRANPKNWNSVVEELRKCILVCHNCHSEIHAGVRQLPKQYHTFDEKFSNVKQVLEYNNCPVCGTEKRATSKFCSSKCASTNRRKVDWNSIDLLQLLKEYSISELEEKLQISNAAIYKRRDKILSLQK